MASGKVTEAQKRAKENYNKRKGRKQRIVEFYETDHADILAHLDAQPNKSAYIRELIRQDMLKAQAAPQEHVASNAAAKPAKPSHHSVADTQTGLFRYSGGFEDVFVEEDHYLYANAGRFGSATRHPATPYEALAGMSPAAGLKRPVTTAYLESLAKAPSDVASDIIRAEHRR